MNILVTCLQSKASMFMILTNKLVVSCSTIQVLVLEGWLGSSAHTHPITVSKLRPGVAHGLGPEEVSLLGGDDHRVVEEGGAGVLSLVLDCAVQSAVEMCVLKYILLCIKALKPETPV